MFWNKYPYTDFHELNLDYVLAAIKLMKDEIENFINFNSIKYADPIEWQITTQYQANTVVFDNIDHIAYLSLKPVPAGVLLSDTEYWTPILDLRSFYDSIGDLNTLDTTARDTLVNAINEVFKIAQSNIIIPEFFGAVGDGVSDDSAAIQAAVNLGKMVLFHPGKTYGVMSTIYPKDNTVIDLNGATIQVINSTPVDVFKIEDVEHVCIRNGIIRNIIGGAGTESGNFEILISSSQDIEVDNIQFENNNSDGIYCGYTYYYTGSDRFITNNIRIHHCMFSTNRNGISLVSGDDVVISDNIFNMPKINEPKAAIDMECETGSAHTLHLNNIIFKDNIINSGYVSLYIGQTSTTGKGVLIANNILHDALSMGNHDNTPVYILDNKFTDINEPVAINARSEVASEALHIINNIFDKANLINSDPFYFGVIAINFGATDPSIVHKEIRIERNIFNECKNTDICIGPGTYTNFSLNEMNIPNDELHYIIIDNLASFTDSFIDFKRMINTSYYILDLGMYNIVNHYNVPSGASIGLSRFAENQYVYCDSFDYALTLTAPTGYTFDGIHTNASLAPTNKPEDIKIRLDYPNKRYYIVTNAVVTYS